MVLGYWGVLSPLNSLYYKDETISEWVSLFITLTPNPSPTGEE